MASWILIRSTPKTWIDPLNRNFRNAAAAAAASWERMEARDPTDVPKLRELFK